MEPRPTSKPRNRDRLKTIFRHKTPKPSQSSSNLKLDASAVANASNTPAATASQNPFKKSENFKKDIAMLSMAYPLAENPDLKELIRLVIVISAEGKVASTVYHTSDLKLIHSLASRHC